MSIYHNLAQPVLQDNSVLSICLCGLYFFHYVGERERERDTDQETALYSRSANIPFFLFFFSRACINQYFLCGFFLSISFFSRSSLCMTTTFIATGNKPQWKRTMRRYPCLYIQRSLRLDFFFLGGRKN